MFLCKEKCKSCSGNENFWKRGCFVSERSQDLELGLGLNSVLPPWQERQLSDPSLRASVLSWAMGKTVLTSCVVTVVVTVIKDKPRRLSSLAHNRSFFPAHMESWWVFSRAGELSPPGELGTQAPSALLQLQLQHTASNVAAERWRAWGSRGGRFYESALEVATLLLFPACGGRRKSKWVWRKAGVDLQPSAKWL